MRTSTARNIVKVFQKYDRSRGTEGKSEDVEVDDGNPSFEVPEAGRRASDSKLLELFAMVVVFSFDRSRYLSRKYLFRSWFQRKMGCGQVRSFTSLPLFTQSLCPPYLLVTVSRC
jgi:hypothetical protein